METFRYKSIHSLGILMRGSPNSSGWDLCAAIDETASIPGHGQALIPAGIILDLDPGWEGQIRPRSGLALWHGITVLNSPGTVDADYRGEVGVILANLSGDEFFIQPGDRIAQLVIVPVPDLRPILVENVSHTARLARRGVIPENPGEEGSHG
jgi:dUTP pyrophosphatase